MLLFLYELDVKLAHTISCKKTGTPIFLLLALKERQQETCKFNITHTRMKELALKSIIINTVWVMLNSGAEEEAS